MRIEPQDGISALIQRGVDIRALCLPFTPAYEDSPGRKLSTSQEKSPHQTLHLQHHGLGLPAFRTWRNKCLLFKTPSLWFFTLAALAMRVGTVCMCVCACRCVSACVCVCRCVSKFMYLCVGVSIV